jgi:phospholipase/carboxylesterase
MLEYRAREGTGGKAVIMLHGFGANGDDLYPLADEIDAARRFTWYFPEAPYDIGYGGNLLGKAWFPRNEEEIESAVEGVYFDRLEQMDPEGLRRSGEETNKLIDTLGVPPENLVLGGFSQGAMVAVEAMLQSGRAPADLLLLSASAIAVERWRTRAGHIGPFGFFQSHGTADPVLPFDGARRLLDLLQNAGGEAEFIQFDGGHMIPPEIMERMARRLVRQAR